ncbi:MAG: Hsp33 family molecular chaperone HslO [Wenzhouxiangellaceae bacterium]|nr:Hsp33 family molecular chaperone HslO [Wenzhouxiangellaceae bacterium]
MSEATNNPGGLESAPDGDHLQRLLLEQANVRCVIAHVDGIYRETLARGHYPRAVAELLGEVLAVTALCSSGIKFSGRISLQLRASSAVKLLMADCTDAGGMRALARFDTPAVLAASGFAEQVAGGVMTMTVEPDGRGQAWQGIVPLAGDSLAEAVAGYFDQSEQLPTRVVLAVDGERAAGLLIQRLPGSAADQDGWTRACKLLETVDAAELLATDAPTLLHRLFHEEERRLFPPRALQFFCPCSRQRVARVLRGLGRDELEALLHERGEVEAGCEFCNQRYHFDRLDITRLLLSDAPDPDSDPDSDHDPPTVH